MQNTDSFGLRNGSYKNEPKNMVRADIGIYRPPRYNSNISEMSGRTHWNKGQIPWKPKYHNISKVTSSGHCDQKQIMKS